LTWGKLPLNDRRLVVIDEASSLPEDIISNLSGVRSSGVAEIVKINTEKTSSRCRIIWVTNPKSGRKLNNYSYGIEAVREVFTKVEDIARIDFIISVASDDIDITNLKEEFTKQVPHKYTSELNTALILWAWSRKKENIKFTPEAVEEILQSTKTLSKLYHSSIPIVEPSEQRVKLARLGAACAARLFSTDDSGENLIVKKEHIEYIVSFLQHIYNKKSLGYDIYSEAQWQKTRVSEEKRKEIIEKFKTFSNWSEIRDVLLENNYFRKTEFIEQTGLSQEDSKEFMKWATKNKLIKSTSAGYMKTPIFTEILKSILYDEPIVTNNDEF